MSNKPNHLRLIICPGLILALAFSACMEQANVPPSVKATIAQVRQTFAPDKRVALFNVEVHASHDTLLLTGETNLPEAHATLLRQLDDAGAIIVDRIKLLPDPAKPARGVVNVSVANIRSAPRHSAELATQALLGMGLKVYKQDDAWFYVQTPDGYLGWLDSGGFTLMDDQAYQRWLDQPKVIFTDDYGLVQDAAGMGSGRVGDLVAGNILADLGVVEGFRSVGYPDGRMGYVAEPSVKTMPDWLNKQSGRDIPDLIGTALKLIGRPYLWGGTSGKGMDCSGFTKTVYLLNGIVLPRDASQQVYAGLDVPTDSTFAGLQTGDFLFFGEPASGSNSDRVRHVGIYLGGGQFIHSGADNPGVKIESLLPASPNFAAHRRSTFLRARRMEIGSPGVVSITELADFFGPSSLLVQ